MHRLLFIIGILFCSACDSQKLVCFGKFIGDHEYNFDHVMIYFQNAESKFLDFTDLKQFDPARKTVFIILGLLGKSFNKWTERIGKK